MKRAILSLVSISLGLVLLSGCVSSAGGETGITEVKLVDIVNYTTTEKTEEESHIGSGETELLETSKTIASPSLTYIDFKDIEPLYSSMEGTEVVNDDSLRITILGVEREKSLVGGTQLKVTFDILNKSTETIVVSANDISIGNRVVQGYSNGIWTDVYSGVIGRLGLTVTESSNHDGNSINCIGYSIWSILSGNTSSI